MTRYKRVPALAKTDAAYIAGLIDGEGTLTLSRKHARESRQVVVSISNTDLELLRYVRDTIVAGKITSKRTTSEHHTPSYTFAVWNRQALALIDQVLPFLRTYKKQRAQLILDEYIKVTPRNGKYTEALREQRNAFEAKVLGSTSRSKPGH